MTTFQSEIRLSKSAADRAKFEDRFRLQRQVRIVYFSRRVLRVPLEVDIAYTDEGYWLATHPYIMVHGLGNTYEEAGKDFLSAAREWFEELKESEADLAPHLIDELTYIRSIFA